MYNPHSLMPHHIQFYGVVEDRKDPCNNGRVRVRAFGWDSHSKQMVPTDTLPWATMVVPPGYETVKPPREGAIVIGFFMDGEARQYPVITGQIPHIPDTQTDPNQGFSDPRQGADLESAPRPPQSVKYNTDGTGATVTEAQQAQRYPYNINEPTNSRLARNEDIANTIVQQKNSNLATNVPVGTGGVPVSANIGIDFTAVFNARALLASLSPQIASLLNTVGNIEICGMSINSLLPAGILVGGFNFQVPSWIDGDIFMAGLEILNILQNGINISGYLNLGIDVAGCIINIPIGGSLQFDGGFKIPLLSGAGAGISVPGLSIGATVHGGFQLGTMGGIPMTAAAQWSEPQSPYNASYPYNQVYESESGHVIEVDDTPGHERLHTFHRSGTFEEIGPDGSKVEKVVKNNYEITMSDHNQLVMGTHSVTSQHDRNDYVQGNRKENVDGDHTETIKGNVTRASLGTVTENISKVRTITLMEGENIDVKGIASHGYEQDFNVIVLGNRNVIVKGAQTIAVVGKCTLMTQGDLDLQVGGDFNVTACGAINMTAADAVIINGNGINIADSGSGININTQQETSITGTPLALNGKTNPLWQP